MNSSAIISLLTKSKDNQINFVEHFIISYFHPTFSCQVSHIGPRTLHWVKKILPQVDLSFIFASFQESETKPGSDWTLFGIHDLIVFVSKKTGISSMETFRFKVSLCLFYRDICQGHQNIYLWSTIMILFNLRSAVPIFSRRWERGKIRTTDRSLDPL